MLGENLVVGHRRLGRKLEVLVGHARVHIVHLAKLSIHVLQLFRGDPVKGLFDLFDLGSHQHTAGRFHQPMFRHRHVDHVGVGFANQAHVQVAKCAGGRRSDAVSSDFVPETGVLEGPGADAKLFTKID